MINSRYYLVLLASLLLSFPAQAAPPVPVTPAPADIGDLNRDTRNNLESVPELSGGSIIDPVEVDPSAMVKPESKISKEQRFILQSVSVLGNETLKSENVIAVVKPFVGKMVGQRELNLITQKITELYTSKGYVTSRCIIPQQEVKNGVVKLQLIEDKLRGIMLAGASSYKYNPSLFAKHFHDMQGKIVNINKINARLLVLQRLPSTRVSPLLRKSALNLTDLVLQITDTADVNSLTIANGASQYTDKQRVMINSQINNLTGNSDTLSLSASTAMSSPKFFNSVDVGYVLPVGEKGGLLKARVNALTYKLDPKVVGYPTSDFIRYQGSSSGLTIGYEQPFLISKGDFWWGLALERQDVRAQTIYHQDFLTFNAGDAFVDSRDKLFVANASLRGNIFDEIIKGYRGYTSVSLKVKHAIEGFMGSMTTEEINRKLINVANAVEPVTGPIGNVTGMDPRFWKYYASVSRTQAMPWQFTMRMSANAEYTTSKKLPNSYDFIGADNGSSGYHFEMALSRPIYTGLIGLVGYKYDTALSYYRDLTPGCNGYATSRGRNTCSTGTPYIELVYRNDFMLIDLKLEGHIAKYEQSQEKLKVNVNYLW